MSEDTKTRKRTDRRAETSRANVLKAQATKAQRQREIKQEVQQFKETITKRKIKPKIPELPEQVPEVPKKRSLYKYKPKEIPQESDSDLSDEEIVISARKTPVARRTREPEYEQYVNELEILRKQMDELRLQREKPKPRRQVSKHREPQQPIIQIVNPAPIPQPLPNAATEEMKNNLLKF